MKSPVKDGPAEVHLFVLWHHARPWADAIIADLERTFRILDAIELRWTPERAPRHYTRLYAQPLPFQSQKVRDCGTGFPLILVVSDDSPAYGRRRKWGTTYTVNTHLFDAKRRYRGLTGSSSIHCTTDLTESDHDLFLLLGRRSADYADAREVPWAGSIRPVARELTGDHGWTSLEEMLTAVELTVRYVRLPDVDDGPDLRLLVSSLCGVCGVEWLISEPDVSPSDAGTRGFPVLIGDGESDVQAITVGDGHHVRQWQDDMLDHRMRGDDGAFVLPPGDALLELSHELARRGTYSATDARLWQDLARAAHVPPGAFDLDVARHTLESGIKERDYVVGAASARDDDDDKSPIVRLVERLRMALRLSLLTDWLWIHRTRRDAGARRSN